VNVAEGPPCRQLLRAFEFTGAGVDAITLLRIVQGGRLRRRLDRGRTYEFGVGDGSTFTDLITPPEMVGWDVCCSALAFATRLPVSGFWARCFHCISAYCKRRFGSGGGQLEGRAIVVGTR